MILDHENHTIRFNAHDFSWRQIGKDSDLLPDQFVGVKMLTNATQDDAMIGTRVN
jgi:hypothetical protein